MANPMVALGALSLTPRSEKKMPKIKQDSCAWGVMNPGFFDENDKFWHPGQMLYFDGEPNTSLHPLNKMAYDKLQTFLDKLDVLGEQVAKKNKKEYVPQARTPWEDDGEADLPVIENVMGVPKKEKNVEIR